MVRICVAITGVTGYTWFKTKTQLVIEARTFCGIYQQSRSEMGCNVKILRKLVPSYQNPSPSYQDPS
jgi:hypothetical protein